MLIGTEFLDGHWMQSMFDVETDFPIYSLKKASVKGLVGKGDTNPHYVSCWRP